MIKKCFFCPAEHTRIDSDYCTFICMLDHFSNSPSVISDQNLDTLYGRLSATYANSYFPDLYERLIKDLEKELHKRKFNATLNSIIND